VKGLIHFSLMKLLNITDATSSCECTFLMLSFCSDNYS